MSGTLPKLSFKLPRRRDLFLAFLALAVIFLVFAFFLDKKIKEKSMRDFGGGGMEAGSGEVSKPEVLETRALLALEPADDVINLNETKTLTLKVIFDNGKREEKLDYFKTEISFPKDYLIIPAGAYIDTSTSGLAKVFRVDGPAVANESGKIVIELGAEAKGSGPSTKEPLAVAKIYFQGRAETDGSQTFVFGETQIVNDQSKALEVEVQDVSFTVSSVLQ